MLGKARSALNLSKYSEIGSGIGISLIRYKTPSSGSSAFSTLALQNSPGKREIAKNALHGLNLNINSNTLSKEEQMALATTTKTLIDSIRSAPNKALFGSELISQTTQYKEQKRETGTNIYAMTLEGKKTEPHSHPYGERTLVVMSGKSEWSFYANNPLSSKKWVRIIMPSYSIVNFSFPPGFNHLFASPQPDNLFALSVHQNDKEEIRSLLSKLGSTGELTTDDPKIMEKLTIPAENPPTPKNTITMTFEDAQEILTSRTPRSR